jgi:hypothetical protein
MSREYLSGDIVILEGESGGENPVTLPLNELYPLCWCICDCSRDDGCAYIPYRVYTGDEVVVKPILEHGALIPADVAGNSLFGLTKLDTGSAYACETMVSGLYCPGSSCQKYGLYKVNNVVVCTPAGQNPVTGFLTLKCPNLSFQGHTVYGSDSRTNNTDFIEVFARNAYEYLEIETDKPLVPGDVLKWYGNTDIPPYPMKWYAVPDTTNRYRIEAYPGSGGKFGKAAVEGGYGKFYLYISVGGGYGAVRTVWERNYKVQCRTVKITLKITGRYGNHR